jgi:cell division inhibitor SepF
MAGRSSRPTPPPRPVREGVTRTRPQPIGDVTGADAVSEGSVVRTLPAKERPSKERQMDAVSPVAKSKSAVRQVSANAKPVVVSPASFNGAQEVADKFKTNQPVILNLQGIDKDLSRRLLDFCSGICYGLSGHMEKVASRVYLLTPADVELSPEERKRIRERGLAV